MTPQEIVWGCRDLRNIILQKSFHLVKKYYINICRCYEKLLIGKKR